MFFFLVDVNNGEDNSHLFSKNKRKQTKREIRH